VSLRVAMTVALQMFSEHLDYQEPTYSLTVYEFPLVMV
jgi:hypothetical protein